MHKRRAEAAAEDDVTSGLAGSRRGRGDTPPSLSWSPAQRLQLLHALEAVDILRLWRPGRNEALWEKVHHQLGLADEDGRAVPSGGSQTLIIIQGFGPRTLRRPTAA